MNRWPKAERNGIRVNQIKVFHCISDRGIHTPKHKQRREGEEGNTTGYNIFICASLLTYYYYNHSILSLMRGSTYSYFGWVAIKIWVDTAVDYDFGDEDITSGASVPPTQTIYSISTTFARLYYTIPIFFLACFTYCCYFYQLLLFSTLPTVLILLLLLLVVITTIAITLLLIRTVILHISKGRGQRVVVIVIAIIDISSIWIVLG